MFKMGLGDNSPNTHIVHKSRVHGALSEHGRQKSGLHPERHAGVRGASPVRVQCNTWAYVVQLRAHATQLLVACGAYFVHAGCNKLGSVWFQVSKLK